MIGRGARDIAGELYRVRIEATPERNGVALPFAANRRNLDVPPQSATGTLVDDARGSPNIRVIEGVNVLLQKVHESALALKHCEELERGGIVLEPTSWWGGDFGRRRRRYWLRRGQFRDVGRFAGAMCAELQHSRRKSFIQQ